MKPKPINLALQGGGAHGAFTWGVLDQLLEDGRVVIEAISGTSAGAMNAVVLADALESSGGDVDAARARLAAFWRDVGEAARLSPLQRNPVNVLMGDFSLDSSPSFLFVDFLSRVASPYDLNPLDLNPLRDLLARHVDFARVRACPHLKLFIATTRVRTGKLRVFRTDEITLDAVLASACLPYMFRAVEIEGEPYWDGGWTGNPALYPFFYSCRSPDILIVQINPLEIDATPTSARRILERMTEIGFNASLMQELRAIEFVGRMLDEGSLDPKRYRKMLVHLIHGEDALEAFGASSRLNAEWAFLQALFTIGRTMAERWLDRHADELGVRSTVDIRALID